MGLRVTPGEGQRSSKCIRKEKRRLGSSRPNPPQPAARSYSHLVLASADAEGQPGDNRTWGWNGWLHFYLLKRGQQSETHFGFFFFNKSTSHCFSYLPISTTPTSRLDLERGYETCWMQRYPGPRSALASQGPKATWHYEKFCKL